MALVGCERSQGYHGSASRLSGITALNQEQAEEWVEILDECLAGERELTPEELEELREYFEKKATTFYHKPLY